MLNGGAARLGEILPQFKRADGWKPKISPTAPHAKDAEVAKATRLPDRIETEGTGGPKTAPASKSLPLRPWREANLSNYGAFFSTLVNSGSAFFTLR